MFQLEYDSLLKTSSSTTSGHSWARATIANFHPVPFLQPIHFGPYQSSRHYTHSLNPKLKTKDALLTSHYRFQYPAIKILEILLKINNKILVQSLGDRAVLLELFDKKSLICCCYSGYVGVYGIIDDPFKEPVHNKGGTSIC